MRVVTMMRWNPAVVDANPTCVYERQRSGRRTTNQVSRHFRIKHQDRTQEEEERGSDLSIASSPSFDSARASLAHQHCNTFWLGSQTTPHSLHHHLNSSGFYLMTPAESTDAVVIQFRPGKDAAASVCLSRG